MKTVQVSEDLNADLAADGTIYGIELLNANVQLSKGKGLVLENLTTGYREKLSLRELKKARGEQNTRWTSYSQLVAEPLAEILRISLTALAETPNF